MSMRRTLVVAVLSLGILAAGTAAATSQGPTEPSTSPPTAAPGTGVTSRPTTAPVTTTEPVPPGGAPGVPPSTTLPRATRPERPAQSAPPRPDRERIAWRGSRAIGTHQDGRLVDGVLLPAEGQVFFTWDHEQLATPNAEARRWGSDHLIRTVLDVLEAHARAHPQAPRTAIGDLSLREGGDIEHHASHENGLDIDIYYPRLDRREEQPSDVNQIDRPVAQDLVDRFVAAGARYVFVGPQTGLVGPPEVVRSLANHDDHLHVRLDPPGSRATGTSWTWEDEAALP